MLDASVALAWSIADEQTQQALDILSSCKQSFVAVPALWPTEVGNGLLIAERKFRIGKEGILAAFEDLAALPIRIYPATTDQREVIYLARDQKLTAYDATYLHLALTLELDLATFDQALGGAAARIGVRVL